jgi:hypothetical protein
MPVDAYPADASLVRERALLLEALTLLVQRQVETDAEVSAQVARTNARVAAIERRAVELENRLVQLAERLTQLAIQVQPDPGLPHRLTVLEAQLELLSAATPSGARLSS